MTGSELLLIGAVVAVGILHTIVPDHWVPITLIARQERWSQREVAKAALVAGTGHTITTLILGLIVWFAGVELASKFGNVLSTISSLALIAFGGWIAISSLRASSAGGHGHSHGHNHGGGHRHAHHGESDGVHGPELVRIATDRGALELSIFETGIPPRFRLSGHSGDQVWLETKREDGGSQRFEFFNRGSYWESIDEIPEPHEFAVSVAVADRDSVNSYEARFEEHHHDHVNGHTRKQKRSLRTTLLLILGSSPMVEGIPAFFAAGKYGTGLIAVMSALFAFSTIATYVVLCVGSVAGLKRVSFGPLEKYGEVLSGAFIALVGIVFLVFPVI